MSTAGYELMGVSINGSEITGIRRQNVSTGLAALLQGGGGSVDRTFGGIMDFAPVLSFTTCDLATALGVAGIAGAALTSTGAVFGFQAGSSSGGRASTYMALSAALGLIVPVRLTASQGREAELELAVYAIGDASNAPLASSAEALTRTQGATAKWTLGPLSIGAGAYPISDITIDFGINVRQVADSGMPWPTQAYIQTRAPQISATLIDQSLLATLLASGSPGLTFSSLAAKFRKIPQGGAARTAAATEEHISVTATKGVATLDTTSGDHGSGVTSTITCSPVHDGTNPVLAIDTTAAL